MKINYFLILLSYILSFSCNAYERTHKAYVATPPNAALFEDEKDIKLKPTLGIADFTIQAAMPLSENTGVSTNLLGGLTGQLNIELGWLYYNRFKEGYFEVQTGYGFGWVDSVVKDAGDLFQDPFSWVQSKYSHDINTIYHKFWLQPSLFYSTESVDFGFIAKGSSVYFSKYDFDYIIEHADPEFIGPKEQENIQFEKEWAFILEPTIEVRFLKQKRVHAFVQFGRVISSQIKKSERNLNPSFLSPRLRTYRHPFYFPVIFTVGLEIPMWDILHDRAE